MKMRLLSIAALAGLVFAGSASAATVVTPEITVTAGNTTNFLDITLANTAGEAVAGYDYFFTVTPTVGAVGLPTFTGDYAIEPTGAGVTSLFPGANPNQGATMNSAGYTLSAGTVQLANNKTLVRLVFGTTAATSGTFNITVTPVLSSVLDGNGNPVTGLTFDPTGSITVTAVPEPVSLSLLGLGGLALLRRKRA